MNVRLLSKILPGWNSDEALKIARYASANGITWAEAMEQRKVKKPAAEPLMEGA